MIFGYSQFLCYVFQRLTHFTLTYVYSMCLLFWEYLHVGLLILKGYEQDGDGNVTSGEVTEILKHT